ncbi:hypothetical protein TEA_006725 [Camellia sinensis var. sinensis]|uniref:Ubiquitin-like domain-containing protein n=1 Tax=Camellia sinensis var. sinensis TaxID=542762 RepID=A0A4S4D7Q0_CAMSN|nr:hypothetical protein TEA_006725 [Camellia sinensis var. sinensis]
MKIFVKTLKGSHFEIEVKPQDTVRLLSSPPHPPPVVDVKKNIESVQGADVYPAPQLMLIHQGKVLKDGTTLEENNVAENSFVVIMLTKNKSSSGEGSTTSTAPTTKAPQTSAPPPTTAIQAPAVTSAAPASVPSPAPAPVPASDSSVIAAIPAHASPLSLIVNNGCSTRSESGVYDQAASNLVAGSNLEGTIQQILDMGGGIWDRDTVVRALRAAFNNPERAVEYLYSGKIKYKKTIGIGDEPVKVDQVVRGSSKHVRGTIDPMIRKEIVQSNPEERELVVNHNSKSTMLK